MLAVDVAMQVAREGYAIVPDAVSAQAIDRLLTAVAPLTSEPEAGSRGGLRHLLRDVPQARDLARAPEVREAAETVLGPACFAVRAILFDKTPGANWKVIWHQDLTIAVQERREVPGFGPWSEKDGVPHVQPPVQLLERMLAVRVHLDDCFAENGPVRVLPGSHREGRLAPDAIDRWKAEGEVVDCLVPRGGLLLMRPLVLHASSPATAPSHRRVLHIEYAVDKLPEGLAWYERW